MRSLSGEYRRCTLVSCLAVKTLCNDRFSGPSWLGLQYGSAPNCCHPQKTANYLSTENNNGKLRTAPTAARLSEIMRWLVWI
jgi:hypothetical protein